MTYTIVSAFPTLIAAFLGAWYAFHLHDKKQDNKTKKEHIAAGNRALFVLIRQYNALLGIKGKIIDPVKDMAPRSLNMRPTLPLKYEHLVIDADSLTFLLETKDRNILMELLIEEERFKAAIQSLNERSKLHIESIQPILAAAGVREKQSYPVDDIKSKLGEQLFLHIERATDEALSHTTNTVESLKNIISKFHSVLKKQYPESSFLQVETNGPLNK